MFKITTGKGFHMTFANGLTVSVQWGRGNYCENRMKDDDATESRDAEVAVWDDSGAWRTKDFFMDIGDDVVGHLDANEVGALISRVMLY